MKYPTLFYRTPGEHRLSGDKTFDYIAVPDEEAAEKLTSAGWYPTLVEAADPPVVGVSLLDKTAPEIYAALPSLSGEELFELLESEQNGKTRKGVVAAIEDAIAKVGG